MVFVWLQLGPDRRFLELCKANRLLAEVVTELEQRVVLSNVLRRPA